MICSTIEKSSPIRTCTNCVEHQILSDEAGRKPGRSERKHPRRARERARHGSTIQYGRPRRSGSCNGGHLPRLQGVKVMWTNRCLVSRCSISLTTGHHRACTPVYASRLTSYPCSCHGRLEQQHASKPGVSVRVLDHSSPLLFSGVFLAAFASILALMHL